MKIEQKAVKLEIAKAKKISLKLIVSESV